jgi:hypothetical protein
VSWSEEVEEEENAPYSVFLKFSFSYEELSRSVVRRRVNEEFNC